MDAQHVTLGMDGGWIVRKHGSTRATKRFDEKEDAVAYGRTLAKKQRVGLYIHGEDGMVQTKETS